MSEYHNRNVRFEITPSLNKIFLEIFGKYADINKIAEECLIQVIRDKANSDQLFRLDTKTDKADSKWF